MSILLELIRALPTNGKWRFNGQREKWIEAAIALVDMEMDERRRRSDRVKANNSEIVDVGLCGVMIQHP